MGICGTVYTLAFVSRNLLITRNIKNQETFSEFQNSHESFFQIFFYITLLVYFIFDMFMTMYFGNEIKLSSNRLSYCLFECNWIDQSHSCKKCFIILTEFIRRPHEMIIGGLYPLNLQTYTRVSFM